MKFPPPLQQLLISLRRLPGVGPKTAQRLAFHLLERDREGARGLMLALDQALEGIVRCRSCRMFADSELCPLCIAETRDRTLLCIVESPADVVAIEEAGGFRGLYFVLHGRLSPLDGIGPVELGLDDLTRRLEADGVKELILATSATVEGEATASYLAGIARRYAIKATRIAHGVPVGGELEYVDSGTLSRAIAGRVAMDTQEW